MRSKYERGSGGRPSVPSNDTRGTRSKRSIFRRTVFLMAVCGVLMFIPLAWKLWDVAIVHHEEYQSRASDQQTLDHEIAASRGKIYDAKGDVMAMSATVYTLILSPNDLRKSVPNKDQDGEMLEDDVWEGEVAAKQEKVAADLLQLVPGLDPERVDAQVHAIKYSYREIKKNIEEEEKEVIQRYIVDNKAASYLYLIEGSKRYYPYSGLASQALGYVNAEGGAVGIEAMYNDVLEGSPGRVVTTKTAAGTEMYNSYSQYVDAVDGYDLHLSIDATIQSYLENTLEEGIIEYDVQNGAFGVVMDPNTGAVLGIASSPDFDPNNYSKITDSILNTKMEENAAALFEKYKADNTENLTDEELLKKAEDQAYYSAVNTQWRSKALNDTYEPGSTFKALVLAAALEEGVVSESDTFYCSGSVQVPGYPKPIKCSKTTGHGSQTLSEAVGHSCNPAFVEIGQRLGIERFYDYFEGFGMKEPTGIDLPGEGSNRKLVWERDVMSGVDLAVASFGQRFQVSPLQMICGFSAVINGGKLMKPYVVQSVSTQDGTIIQNTEPEIIRQVVSRESSRRASEILEKVVSEGTGGNAYVAGYRIGGKTGSSETTEEGRTIVSFMGFAPAENPQVIVLIAYDKPQESAANPKVGTCGTFISGGNMAAPKAGPLIAKILDYMGVEKEYTAEESAAVDVSTPRLTGKSLADAQSALSKSNLGFRTIGSGDTVTSQIPAAGAPVPGGSTVILYLGDAVPQEKGVVPDVTGLNYEAARKRLESAGFFMRASGVSTYYGNTTTAESQSVSGGEEAAIGTVVNVGFFNVMEDGSVGVW